MTDKNDTENSNSKTEVSKFYYASLLSITFVIASGLAAQNALYGYEQGTNELRMIITGALFFIGDLALIALCYRLFPTWLANTFAVLSIVGFALMSMFAGFAFLVGQQSQKDNYQIISNQAQVRRLDAHILTLATNDKINRRDTLREISRLNKEIKAESDKKGGYVSSGSAAYLMIAKATPYSFDQVSLVVRSMWSMVFVIGSMALGGILSSVHYKKENTAKKIKKKQAPSESHGNTSVEQSDSSAVNSKHYKRALAWVFKRGAPGTGFFVKDLKPVISTKEKVQREIIKQLLDSKEIDRVKSGTGYSYSRGDGQPIKQEPEKSNVFKILSKK